jgi:hypothetical protein
VEYPERERFWGIEGAGGRWWVPNVVLDTQGYVVRRCALERVPTTRGGGYGQAATAQQRSGGGRGGEGRGNVGSNKLCDDQLSGRVEGIVCSAGTPSRWVAMAGLWQPCTEALDRKTNWCEHVMSSSAGGAEAYRQ